MTPLKILSEQEQEKLNPLLLEIISYRKSGLSLNHIIGCTLDCAYCVRHFFDNFEMKIPHMLCSDDEAVTKLVNHHYFIPNKTPIQIFNRATDPFLINVKTHTLEVLKKLDNLRLRNPVLIITRAKVTKEDVLELEQLRNLKITIFVTYSGIIDSRIEPIAKSQITTQSIQTIAKYKNKTRLILYWRPIVEGWNDDSDSFKRVFEMAQYVDSVVYTGYYHRPENFAYLKSIGIELNYGEFGRRKFLSADIDEKIINEYQKANIKAPLFRKTSCGVAFTHGTADYNGHWGVNELCNICPNSQREICGKHYVAPSGDDFQALLDKYKYQTSFLIEDGHVWTEGLGEEKRYHIQHTLEYQVWDIEKPHFKNQHGRSPFGHVINQDDKAVYEQIRSEFHKTIKECDD